MWREKKRRKNGLHTVDYEVFQSLGPALDLNFSSQTRWSLREKPLFSVAYTETHSISPSISLLLSLTNNIVLTADIYYGYQARV